MTRRRLGDLLLEAGLVDREQLQAGLDRRRHTGERLGQALVSLGCLREETIARALAEQLDLDYLDSPEEAPACAPPGTISEGDSRRYRAVPLGERGGRLAVAMPDPLNAYAVEQLSYTTGRPLSLVVCTEETLDRILDRYYPKAGLPGPERDRLRAPTRLAGRIGGGRPAATAGPGKAPPALDERSGMATVNRLLLQAVSGDATELHLEPSPSGGRARCRTAGLLREIASFPKELFGSVLAHVRGMAGLDLTEIGATGEGWFELDDDDYELSVRALYLRLAGGDRAVLHLVDRQRLPATLTETGMEGEVLAGYRHLLRLPSGMVLVSSPHEAQLRAVMRASAAAANDPSKLVALLESSPGRQVPGVMHVVWGTGRVLDAKAAARAVAGQDVDVVVVSGPLVDRGAAMEVANLALEGRLVVVGMAAAGPEEAVARFELGGVPGGVTANVLRGVLSHRSARRMCPTCLGGTVIREAAPGRLARAAVPARSGCAHCEWTGYQGTVGIFALALAGAPRPDGSRLEHVASFADDARAKVLAGLVDEAEVARCLGGKLGPAEHPWGLLVTDRVVG